MSAADDQLAIADLLARFNRHLDDRDFEAWSELFEVDGSFNHMIGRAAIHEMITTAELATNPDLIRKHTVHNLSVHLDGDRATSVCDLVMFDQYVSGGPWRIVTGRYTDSLVRRGDGRWGFQHRDLVMVGKEESPHETFGQSRR